MNKTTYLVAKKALAHFSKTYYQITKVQDLCFAASFLILRPQK